MSSQHIIKRYRINPVELFIFIGVCSGFGYSVVNLFNQTDTFKVAALKPMNSQPNRVLITQLPESEASRAPASDSSGHSERTLEISPKYNPTVIRQ
jgi:hypothetical protein